MGNFDYLKKEKDFESFADIACVAEQTFSVDYSTCIINCRRALEGAIKWMYSVDSELEVPYPDKLNNLMNTDVFRRIITRDMFIQIDYIRKIGNEAAHTNKKTTKDMAKLCLKNLFGFLDFIYWSYFEGHTQRTFDESLLEKTTPESIPVVNEVSLDELVAENKALKAELTQRRIEQQNNNTYVPANPLSLSEYETRKLYIDSMLVDAGWREDSDWINEVELPGMPNKSEVGFADYVLYDDAHKPLAVIEAKKTCVDVSKGRQQGKLYCDLLEQKYHRRPVLFLSNGFDTRIIDNQYPERTVSSIYSKRDLEKLFNLQTEKNHLKFVDVDKNIAGRYYQIEAIKAVCEAFDARNRRKALLVMATGSGKTRTVIGLVDVLLKNGWVKNILFLADRKSLVTQAKRSFVNLLPSLSCTNLVEEKDNYNARVVFSTYNTMMNCIDSAKENDEKIYTCGHFDLIIVDEAHRSIYNKYKDIFNYFDAPLVGLTATPKDEIDKNTYDIFELESGVPTYGYELDQAVKDGYLVDFVSAETVIKFLDEGITYADLTDEEKAEYEATFADENGQIPDKIAPSKLNSWVFNEDTIKKVLDVLMKNGLRVDYGQKIGKTIIFAKNHEHAEAILKMFNKEYPHLKDYAMVIDNYINYSQSMIDQFSDPNKLPQIAISVDMLDTGIDIPEVVNLVFFKKVMSKAKFWQMIGRGTRLCPGLFNGDDKKQFYIFDFCGNFEFFRENAGNATPNTIPIQGAIFALKFDIIFKLQDLMYQTDELQKFRSGLIDELVPQVKELDRDSFDVRQHLKYVDQFSNPDNYKLLTYADTLFVRSELAHLIKPIDDDISAVRFDALLYGLELAYLAQKKYSTAKSELRRKLISLSKLGTIPEIEAKKDFITSVLSDGYIEKCDIDGFEKIRTELRDLMKYIPKDGTRYVTNFTDDIINTEWNDSDLTSDDLKNYKAKIEHYIRDHQEDNTAISKLRQNKPLDSKDINELESVLWKDLGTKQDYYSEIGDKPLGEFIRGIVGLDMNAAKEAFAKYLDDQTMNSNQIYFVNKIVEYIVMNGMLKDASVLQDSPFTDKGNVVDLFGDSLDVWSGIQSVINNINKNADFNN